MTDDREPPAAENEPVEAKRDPDPARDAFPEGPQPVDPRAKEATLNRLRDAPDEQLAVFADRLRGDAREAGASERDVREAEAGHPERG